MQRVTFMVSMSLSHYYVKRSYQPCLLVRVPARCKLKVTLHHTCDLLHMCRVVQHMHDICMVYIRRNIVHGRPKLLIGLGTGNRFHSFFSIYKGLCLALLAWGLVRHTSISWCHLRQCDISNSYITSTGDVSSLNCNTRGHVALEGGVI